MIIKSKDKHGNIIEFNAKEKQDIQLMDYEKRCNYNHW